MQDSKLDPTIISLVERFATELKLFFILTSLILSLDSSAAFFQSRNIVTMDWSIGKSITLGTGSLFVLGFSFSMTVLSPILLYILRLFAPSRLLLPAKDASMSIKEWNASGWALRGHVLDRGWADRDQALLSLVKKYDHDQMSSEMSEALISRLSFCVLFWSIVDLLLGFKSRGTLLWIIGTAQDSRWIWLFVPFFVVVVCGLLPSFRSPSMDWIYCPPVALEDRRKANGAAGNTC